MNLDIIIEKGENVLYGRIEGNEYFSPVTAADSKKEILENLKMLIKDYQEHEGKEDSFWQKIDTEKASFEFRYDLQAFFAEYDFINASAIARHAGMNESLVRQYASGKKFPSAEQTQKLESTIRSLTKPLQKLSLYAKA